MSDPDSEAVGRTSTSSCVLSSLLKTDPRHDPIKSIFPDADISADNQSAMSNLAKQATTEHYFRATKEHQVSKPSSPEEVQSVTGCPGREIRDVLASVPWWLTVWANTCNLGIKNKEGYHLWWTNINSHDQM